MHNSTKGNAKRMKCPAYDAGAAVVHAGWIDYRDGLGYRPEYDLWLTVDQKRYELGRHYAAIAKATLGNIPAWPRNRLLKPGDAATRAMKAEMAVFVRSNH
jgi:hypothetical protein